MYTPFAHAFAYAIKQTPYAFVAKIILCMYLLYGSVERREFPLGTPVSSHRESWHGGLGNTGQH